MRRALLRGPAESCQMTMTKATMLNFPTHQLNDEGKHEIQPHIRFSVDEVASTIVSLRPLGRHVEVVLEAVHGISRERSKCGGGGDRAFASWSVGPLLGRYRHATVRRYDGTTRRAHVLDLVPSCRRREEGNGCSEVRGGHPLGLLLFCK